ncbi:hypothetical protein [Actinophytocola sp.]|uniref:hypothetical protein n=1 Tax=Actinophytocola sp. TaxID=1872138 RepID=UPI002D7E3F80|nr:hypothetical protein [Actinophytocola sp.]HET9138647.1 hypothetical protein [Actinophytocola sp.]
MSEDVSRFAGEEHHGWSPDVGSGGSERATEANEKAFGEPQGERGPGRVVSDEEREGVSSTDTEPDSPHGVGSSRSATHGEDFADDTAEGTKDPSGRPYGTVEGD